MNYAALVTAVSDYLENSFSTEVINQCITQAETRIYNTVQIPALRKNVTGFTETGVKYVSCPSDFLSSYSIATIDPVTGDYLYLLNKDVNFIREAYPNPTATGAPKYYALFGPTTTNTVPPVITTELTFLVGPTPNGNYGVELHYYYYPESIVTAGTTWLGDNYDPALFYGTIVEAYTFMKGEQDMMVLYNTKYSESLSQLKRLGDGLERQDAYRSGQARVAVT
jgi:hypothetical protein